MHFQIQKILRSKRSAVVLGLILAAAGTICFTILAGLPNREEIKSYRPPATAKSQDITPGKPPENPVRIWVPLQQISPWLQKAVIISEDDMFYQHNGINLVTMKQAFQVNWEKKRYVRGASTITMQLARNAFLHKRKTLLRKLREVLLARRIEQHLSKPQILELYLNIVEWGKNIYGAEAAARYYFEKSAADLDLSEATMLAAMLPNPKYFDPYKRPESCKRMQKRVLSLLTGARQITTEEARQARDKGTQVEDTAADQLFPVDSLEEEKYFTSGIEVDAPTFPATAASLSAYDSLAPEDSSGLDLISGDAVAETLHLDLDNEMLEDQP